MSCNSSIYSFTIELWEKEIVTRNTAGQVVTDWVLTKQMKCDFMPSRAEERLVGRHQNPISYNVWVHGNEPVTVDKQLRNLKDPQGNVVDEGPFNIIGVRPHPGLFSIEFLTINAQKVLN